MGLLARFAAASSYAVDAITATWIGHSQENALLVSRILVRTVYVVLVDVELRPIFAQSQSLFEKRRQQRPPDDPPPPLFPPSPPRRTWAGSGRRRRPAPSVTRPRPQPPPAHYHSKWVKRRSPPLSFCRQPPPSHRAIHELERGAANG